METHDKILHILIEHDRKESTKPGYNQYALAIYCGGLQAIDEELSAGSELRACLVQHFCGRLLDKILRGLGLPLSTRAEQMM